MIHNGDLDCIELRLTPDECRHLSQVLDRHAVDAASPDVSQRADEFLSVVGDAQAVATWLGESAAVELPGPEARHILQMLQQLADTASMMPEERELLRSVCRSMLECLSLGRQAR